MPPVIACASAVFADKPLEFILPALAEAGYGGVAIRARQLHDRDPQALAGLRGLARELKLRLVSLQAPFAITRDLPDVLDQSYAMAGLAVVYGRAVAGTEGPPMIRVGLDAGEHRVDSTAATEDHWLRAATALGRFAALDPDTMFLVEAQPGTLADSAATALALLQRVEAPNLALAWHPHGDDPVSDWRRLGHAVRMVVLPGAASRAPTPGLHALLAALRADGFDGVLCVDSAGPSVAPEQPAATRAWLRGHGF